MRLADCRDLRKGIAGVIQGDVEFVGATWNAAEATSSMPGRCGFRMRWSGGRAAAGHGWPGVFQREAAGGGVCREAGPGLDGAVMPKAGEGTTCQGYRLGRA